MRHRECQKKNSPHTKNLYLLHILISKNNFPTRWKDLHYYDEYIIR